LSVTYSVDESAYTLGIRLTWLFWGIVVYQSIKKGSEPILTDRSRSNANKMFNQSLLPPSGGKREMIKDYDKGIKKTIKSK